MKISKLSYKIENIEIKGPYSGYEKYTAFFYTIDGIKIKGSKDHYNPIDAYDVIDEEAIDDGIVIIFRCTCGCWQCSSIYAFAQELPNEIIKWTIKEHGGTNRPEEEYFFNKSEYEKTMEKIREEATEIINHGKNN